MSFLGLEGLHVFITGAAGGIGGQAVKEFLGRYYISCLSLYVCTFENLLDGRLRSLLPVMPGTRHFRSTILCVREDLFLDAGDM